MGWKTIFVKEKNYLNLKQNQLVYKKDDKSYLIPLHDLNCVVFDNNYSFVTTQLLSKLAENDVFVLICDSKHDPVSIVLPYNSKAAMLSVHKLQIEAKKPFIKRLWNRIIRSKILNSAIVLKNAQYPAQKVNWLKNLVTRVVNGDKNGCEGQAAKFFYKTLYGSSFVRFHDDGINSAVNYGRKILASAISRSLSQHGFQLFLGINHHSESNYFNLTYDLIEPFQPIVDYLIDSMDESIADTLTYNQRLELVKILNCEVVIDNKIQTVSEAIKIMCSSLLTAFKTAESDKLLLPKLVFSKNEYYEGYE